jgi:hypothetical protein
VSDEKREKPIVVPPPPAGLERMGRRHWLGAAAALAGMAVGFWPRGAAGRIRPPGALPPGDFERACIRCFRAEVARRAHPLRQRPTCAERHAPDRLPRSRLHPCMKCTEAH